MFVKLGDDYLNLDTVVGFGATEDSARVTVAIVGDPGAEYELPITPRTLHSIMSAYARSQNRNRVLDYSDYVEQDDFLPPENVGEGR